MEESSKQKSTVRDQARLEKQRKLAETLRERVDAEENGDDIDRKKNWEYSIEENDDWEKRLARKKRRSNFEFNGKSSSSPSLHSSTACLQFRSLSKSLGCGACSTRRVFRFSVFDRRWTAAIDHTRLFFYHLELLRTQIYALTDIFSVRLRGCCSQTIQERYRFPEARLTSLRATESRCQRLVVVCLSCARRSLSGRQYSQLCRSQAKRRSYRPSCL